MTSQLHTKVLPRYSSSMRRIVLSLAFVLPACSGGSSDDGDSNETGNGTSSSEPTGGTDGMNPDGEAGTGNGDGMGEAGTEGDGETGGMEPVACEVDPSLASALVTVKDTDGNILKDTGFQFCGPVNETGMVELCATPKCFMDDGRGLVEVVKPGVYNLKVIIGNTETTNYSGSAVGVDAVVGETAEVEGLLPIVGEFTDLEGKPETTVQIDSMMSVTIDPADDKTDFGFGTATALAGAQLDEAHWPFTTVGDNNDDILAIWTFAPFPVKAKKDAESTEYLTSFAFEIADSLGLEDGATVNLYTIDKENAWIEEAGTATVAEGAIKSGEEGLHSLGWLIIAAPAAE